MQKKAYILLTLSFFNENEQWVARCEELGLSSFGDSLEETQVSIEEFIKGHIETLSEVGELGRFLRENNIPTYPKIPRKTPINIPIRSNYFTERRAVPVGDFACT
jgi:predicted RNase H-like HicB family nuclease